ncbi:MAG: DEAD/DEAH box helicase [Deltaproteobacteria bacterium]|nr:DEAD/DEAH box helicase [Deltaproteobacteria bacterium]
MIQTPPGSTHIPPPRRPVAEKGVRLRAWQRQALEAFDQSPDPSFLAVATPGAGKTTFALTVARRALVARTIKRVVIVVPTQHLKVQWAQAAERFGIHLDPDWASAYGVLPSDVHGVVVTYQQVAANPQALRQLVRESLAVLDEVHHAADSRSWGDGVRVAFELAWRRLCLSGTPFRSDQSSIPFVRYEGDLACSDYEYGYAEALKDRSVVRPVYFPRINGRMEWTAPDGNVYSATFEDKLTRELASQRLRTALDVEGEWLPAVLTQAHAQLIHLRGKDPRAAGLVIAMDQDHARGIAEILRERTGVIATVATSDDPVASHKIEQFSEGNEPWIVAVRMVSEGVDIPRLRVGVYATNTVTDLFFRQAVGRLVRWHGPTTKQTAYMFIPDDPRVRASAFTIAEQRRHSLRKKEDPDDAFGGQAPPREDRSDEELPQDEQLSLFTALSAVPLDEQGRPLDESRVFEDAGEEIPDFVGGSADPPTAPLETAWEAEAPLPLPEPEPEPVALPLPAGSPLAKRRELREKNSAAVRELVHLTGKRHADVNAELNKKSGVKSISEASIRQLEKRLVVAQEWLRKL